MARRLALITGASSGIGLAFARVYATHGWDLLLTARREERLIKLCDEIRLKYGVEAHYLAADMADPTTPAALEAKVQGLGRTLDGLVNNAGYGMPDGFVANPLDKNSAASSMSLPLRVSCQAAKPQRYMPPLNPIRLSFHKASIWRCAI